MDVQLPFSIAMRGGKPYVHLMSIGPDDESHPGLPEVQSNRLKHALAAGVRLMRGEVGVISLTLAISLCKRKLESLHYETAKPLKIAKSRSPS